MKTRIISTIIRYDITMNYNQQDEIKGATEFMFPELKYMLFVHKNILTQSLDNSHGEHIRSL